MFFECTSKKLSISSFTTMMLKKTYITTYLYNITQIILFVIDCFVRFSMFELSEWAMMMTLQDICQVCLLLMCIIEIVVHLAMMYI